MGVELSKEDILELETEDLLKLKLWSIPAVDLGIMSMGAFLGMKGWTPVTALINGLGGALRSDAFSITIPFIPPFSLDFFGLFGIRPVQGEPPMPQVDLQNVIATAFIGAIEAYTITRPGFLQAVGEILPL